MFKNASIFAFGLFSVVCFFFSKQIYNFGNECEIESNLVCTFFYVTSIPKSKPIHNDGQWHF